jgi:hypothetical protein
VLLHPDAEQREVLGDVVLIAFSKWIGDRVPSADEPALRPILRLTFPHYDNHPCVEWFGIDELSSDLVPIGTITPSPQEQKLAQDGVGWFDAYMKKPLQQWRWDNDRAALIAEEEAEKQREAEAEKKCQEERKRYLRSLTLHDLREYSFLTRWKKYPPPKATRESRKVLRNAVDSLVELGPAATKQKKLAILQQCIESINNLDEKLDHFIETQEREDICEEFDAIVHAAGLGKLKNLADRWRDW